MKIELGWGSIEWSSRVNAVAPFDFKAVNSNGIEVRMDAKSTDGEFERVIHMSAAELAAAAEGSRYDLWRVYGINDSGAKLRIAEDVGALAKTVVAAVNLPPGIRVDSVSFDPSALEWGPEIVIERPEDAPDGE